MIMEFDQLYGRVGVISFSWETTFSRELVPEEDVPHIMSVFGSPALTSLKL
jgi:hypothetical protein